MATYKRGSGNYKSSFLQIVIKKANETVNNSETLIDDAELKIPLKANKSYAGFLMLRFTSPAAADLDFTFKDMTGATNDSVNGSVTLLDDVGHGTEIQINSTNVNQTVMLSFHCTMGSTAADLQFQWAQATATVGNTLVLAGSMLVVFEA